MQRSTCSKRGPTMLGSGSVTNHLLYLPLTLGRYYPNVDTYTQYLPACMLDSPLHRPDGNCSLHYTDALPFLATASHEQI